MTDRVNAAIRMLPRRRLGVVSVALSMAVGVGLNTALIGLLRDTFVSPLPYRDPGQLVTIRAKARSDEPREFLTEIQATEIRKHPDLFSEVATIERWPASRRGWMDYHDDQGVVRVAGALVTPNVFALLGVQPLGRVFSWEEARAGARVAVITADFAERRYRTTDVLGRPARINGDWFQIVGVLPRRFIAPVAALPPPYAHLHDVAVWVPQDPGQLDGGVGTAIAFSVIARMAPGQPPRAIQSELNRRAQSTFKGDQPGFGVIPLRVAMLGNAIDGFRVLATIGLLLLLMGIANVVTVAMLRIDGRRRDTAIRIALGASRARAVAPAALEALAAGVAFGVLGALFGTIAQRGIRAVLPAAPWQPPPAIVDWQSGLIALAITLAAAAAGVAAAARLSRSPSLALTLNTETDSIVTTLPAGLRTVLVAQLVLVIVLLTPAVALWQGLRETRAPALDRRDVIAAEMWLVRRALGEGSAAATQNAIAQRMRALPGVHAVGVGSQTPWLDPETPNWIVRLSSGAARRTRISVWGGAVDGEYLRLLQLEPIRGRSFDDQDTARSRPVAIVSAALGREAFGGADPVGQLLQFHGERTIVGVVPDLPQADGRPRPTLYVPRAQEPLVKLTFLVEASSPGARREVIKALPGVSTDHPFDRIFTLNEAFDIAFARQRLYRSVAASFAAAALVLGAIGIYLVSHYLVRRRIREIGLRLALGATPGHVGMLLGREVLPAIVGAVVIGTPLSIAALHRIRESFAPIVLPENVPYTAAAGVALLCVSVAAVVAAHFSRREPARLLGRPGADRAAAPRALPRDVQRCVGTIPDCT